MPQTFRAVAYVSPGEAGLAFDLAILMHDERRVRRRMLTLVHGDQVLVDFPEPVTLADRSALRLEDGRLVEIIAGEENLYEVRGRDDLHLMRLCWHLGNRHLKTQIEPGRVLILRDHVIRDMLLGLGATVTDVSEPFHPEEGAYSHSHEPVHALLNR
ncbi:MAG: ureE1 [Devosia sp.]|uniref:urease accessory protein UreE n=1 Tax=Devosia sp. TaxID=1871048 RepID=UPI0026189780|nr:urease accessory protein UreE [Devosia sp.]MDB5540489.1 ureE1 [Devosia sp.]